MRKPVNKFAAALWVLAAFVFVSEFGSYVWALGTAKEMALQEDHFYLVENGLWRIIYATTLASAQILSLGVLIELVDQIRWDMLHRLK